MNEEKVAPGEQAHWFVMLHLNPLLIERQLMAENADRRESDLPLYEYFIPYRFLKKAVAEQYTSNATKEAKVAAKTNSWRDDLRHFVFIKTTGREISHLVDKPWNREGRLHLRFYRTKSGKRITVPEQMMTPLITLCCENRQRFSFGPPVKEVAEQDVVVIREGLFKDIEATVLQVQHTADGISLTLGIEMFDGTKSLRLPGYRVGDVRFRKGSADILNDYFIDNVENELLQILRRRIKRHETEETRRKDAATLNYLYHYSYIHIDDAATYRRFRALMLLCATLRKDAFGKATLTAEVQEMLGGVSLPATDEQACLMAALFIATGHADYRTSLKAYRQQHEIISPSLQAFMPLITRLKTR